MDCDRPQASKDYKHQRQFEAEDETLRINWGRVSEANPL